MVSRYIYIYIYVYIYIYIWYQETANMLDTSIVCALISSVSCHFMSFHPIFCIKRHRGTGSCGVCTADASDALLWDGHREVIAAARGSLHGTSFVYASTRWMMLIDIVDCRYWCSRFGCSYVFPICPCTHDHIQHLIYLCGIKRLTYAVWAPSNVFSLGTCWMLWSRWLLSQWPWMQKRWRCWRTDGFRLRKRVAGCCFENGSGWVVLKMQHIVFYPHKLHGIIVVYPHKL